MPSSGGVFVDGAARLSRTAKAAARAMLDLRPAHAAAGAVMVPAARDAAPVVSGALGNSVHVVVGVSSFELVSDKEYAGVVHWGWPKRHIEAQPFLVEAARRTDSQATAVVATGFDKVLHTIKGA